MLSEAIARELENALLPRLGTVRVESSKRTGGGCISTTLQVRLSGGQSVFVKLAGTEPPGAELLSCEADALERLRAAGQVRVPEVLARGKSFLATEWLEPGPGAPASWAALGRGLARLHQASAAAAPGYGWPTDNFIGSLPQANGTLADWPRFWWERRIQPQLDRARTAGLLGEQEAAGFARLHSRLPQLLEVAAAEGPALLHGDLWSGNVHMTASGEAAIIDPASYYGHREVDLAMTALFGGFHPEFYRSYHETWPLERQGLEPRRACYQLYYLLVHVNLFGRGYVGGTLDALQRALS